MFNSNVVNTTDTKSTNNRRQTIEVELNIQHPINLKPPFPFRWSPSEIKEFLIRSI